MSRGVEIKETIVVLLRVSLTILVSHALWEYSQFLGLWAGLIVYALSFVVFLAVYLSKQEKTKVKE